MYFFAPATAARDEDVDDGRRPAERHGGAADQDHGAAHSWAGGRSTSAPSRSACSLTMKTSTEEGEGLHGNAKMEKFPAAAADVCVAVGREKDRVNLAKNPKLHKLSHVASVHSHATTHRCTRPRPGSPPSSPPAGPL